MEWWTKYHIAGFYVQNEIDITLFVHIQISMLIFANSSTPIQTKYLYAQFWNSEKFSWKDNKYPYNAVHLTSYFCF